MKLKKNIAKAIAVAMILGVSVSSNAFASLAPVMAEETGTTTNTSTDAPLLVIDYYDYTATIYYASEDSNGASYFFLDVYKDKEGTKTPTTYCYPIREYMYEVGEGDNVQSYPCVTVDLSFLKATKESYIKVRSDISSKASEMKTISAQPGKLKIKYAPKYTENKLDTYGSFTVTENKAAVTLTQDNIDNYMYRTMYGSRWYSLDEFDLETSMIAGTTLVVKRAAVDDDSEAKTVGAPAGAEVKVKISAIPKAPKVSIDYVKGMVKFAKNAEYRVVYTKSTISDETTTTDVDETDWIAAAATTMTPEAILKSVKGIAETDVTNNLASGFQIIVRTQAGKKAASAMTFVEVDGQKKAEQTKVDEKLKDEITVALTDSTKATLTWTVGEKDVTFTATGASFQYTIGDGKAKTIKPGKAVKVKLTSATDFKLALAGQKENKKTNTAGYFASSTVTVKVTPVTPTPSASPAPSEGDSTGGQEGGQQTGQETT